MSEAEISENKIMISAFRIKKLLPCGCDNEGHVLGELQGNPDTQLYYQGSDEQAKDAFQIGSTMHLDIKTCYSATEKQPHVYKILRLPNQT